jgi:hypothetical protein
MVTGQVVPCRWRKPIVWLPVLAKLGSSSNTGRIFMSNRPFKVWVTVEGGSVIINARQIVVVAADGGVANVVNVTLANGGTEMIKATLADFKDWLLGID